MKFVALVSGGKDSCFNILHCLNAGHELVAMANLRPQSNRPDEIDSWMFQTVGHQAVELLAQCAGVPLFRSEISEDESAVISELVELLARIRSEIDFDGVSVGAIASTYQQIRVDKACAQLGLRTLSYLWQRDQRELLKEINRSGMDVRVVKVAGQSLGAQHLGRSLRDIEQDLLAKNEEFGLHPCGEGGEYETMVFDAPFFDKLMVMSAVKVVHHSTDDVFYLDFAVSSASKDTPTETVLDVPPLLEPQFARLGEPRSLEIGDRVFPKTVDLGPKVSSQTFQGTFESCFAEIEKSAQLSTAFHVMVVLKDMKRFAEMNAIYSALFAQIPGDIAPSRACIQASIPWDAEVTVFSTAEADPSGKGIHVQGLSYWAPASIGPYSQCRMVYGISYVAGQIGLIPQTLELASDKVVQAQLALQHAVRVLDVVHERGNWTPRLAVAWTTDASNLQLVREVWAAQYPTFPLITAVVEGLPRNAEFEWSLQACDSRYFAWYIPENDEEDELYSPRPELLKVTKDGYIHRAGFQTTVVSTQKPETYHIVFSTEKVSGNWVPSAVYINEFAVPNVYIQL